MIETLKTYERAGARVYRQYGRLEDFHAKGFHFTNIIQNWDASENYDFAIPTDCDEFLAVFTDAGLSCQKDQIHAYLDSLKGEPRALGIEHSLYNVPAKPGYYCASPYPKGFFSAGTIGTLDHGFHEPVSRMAGGRRGTRITYLHFHNKPFADLLEGAAISWHILSTVTDIDALRAFTGPGRHLTRYFLMSETDYMSESNERLLLKFKQFSYLMKGLGVSNALIGKDDTSIDATKDLALPMIYPQDQRFGIRQVRNFDGAVYLSLNEDIRFVGDATPRSLPLVWLPRGTPGRACDATSSRECVLSNRH